VSSRKRRKLLVVFLGDAHRKSGVISLCFALSPVESCSPPEFVELTPLMYAWNSRNASEQIGNKDAERFATVENRGSYLSRYF
jgi:hypothetical protein